MHSRYLLLPSAALLVSLLFQVTFCYIASLYFFQNSGKFASVNSSYTEIPDTLLRSKRVTQERKWREGGELAQNQLRRQEVGVFLHVVKVLFWDE